MARLALLLTLPLLASDHAGKVAWVRDPDAGMSQAKSTGRFALLYFTGSW